MLPLRSKQAACYDSMREHEVASRLGKPANALITAAVTLLTDVGSGFRKAFVYQRQGNALRWYILFVKQTIVVWYRTTFLLCV